MKMVFLAPLAALALAGAGTGAYLWVTAEGGTEQHPGVQAPAASPTATAPGGVQPTPTPDLLAQPSPEPVPTGWLSYTDAGTGVTLRYPPEWVVEKKEFAGYPDLGVPPAYRVDIYKPIPGLTPVPQSEGLFRSAKVSIWPPDRDPRFLEWWRCDHPAIKSTVGGFPADLCVYVQGTNPHPQGGMTAAEGAYMFYTVHSPGRELYIGVILYLWDETGKLGTAWSPADEERAKRVVESLEVR